MKPGTKITRRTTLKSLGALGALATMGTAAAPGQERRSTPAKPADVREQIEARVRATKFVDTHEHLVEESQRVRFTRSGLLPCDDWALLFSHYLNSDLVSSGMPGADHDRFLSPEVDPGEKWKLLAPWWPAVKNTGYAQAVTIALQQLYGVETLNESAIPTLQAAYENLRQPGFYRKVLQETAGIESCQVNCLTGEPFKQSEQPELLMQDLGIVGMFSGPSIGQYAKPSGIEVKELADWHRVITWWFDRYARYAVAVKSQNAYSRDIDYARVPAEQAEPIFRNVLDKEPVSAEERKRLEDHLFWRAVDEATARDLPVKLHTGFYAGTNSMPLSRLRNNAGSACELCRLSPSTRFVFMHIGYPYYEEIVALAKQWSNAHVDMCWAWIINPAGAKDYLKKHLLAAPANKLFPFGGDYIPVEPVVGHAELARRGITRALGELVDEGWMKLDDALEIIEPLMRGNAHRVFRIPARLEALQKAPWAGGK